MSSCFSGCANLSQFSIQSSQNESINNVVNGSSLQTMTSSFANCTTLKNATIISTYSNGFSVSYCFSGCTSLESVTLDGEFIRNLGSSCFENCTSLQSLTFTQSECIPRSDISFEWSSGLTEDSLISIANALTSLTSGTSATLPTIKLKSSLYT